MCKTGALSRVISTDCELTSSPFGKGLPICLLSGHMYKGHFIDAIILPFETLRRILFMNQICYGGVDGLFIWFAWLISRTFSANEQYFSLTINQPTVLSVMAYQPSEQGIRVG